MQNISKKIIGLSLFAALAASLYSCAVMRIDVDAYKGPLANHEQVQIEQMAVMAIGAKPLLISLRDKLEWGDVQDASSAFDDKGASKWERDWYKPDFVPFPGRAGVAEKKWFQDDRAIRVNGVLGLYKDQGPEGLFSVIGDVQRFRLDFQSSDQVIKRNKGKLGEFWKEKQKAFYGENLEEHPVVKYLNDNKPEASAGVSSDKDVTAFKNAYRILKTDYMQIQNEVDASQENEGNGYNQSKPVKRIAHAHNVLLSIANKYKDCSELNKFQTASKMNEIVSSRAFFELQKGDGALIGLHFDILLKDKDNKKEIVNYIKEFSFNFVEFRAAAGKLLDAMLRSLTQVDRLQQSGEHLPPLLPLSLSKAVGTLLSVESLTKNKDRYMQKAKDNMQREDIKSIFDSAIARRNELVNNDDLKAAGALIGLHRRYMKNFEQEFGGGVPEGMPKFGIAPFVHDSSDFNPLANMLESVTETCSGSGFDRGRKREGLDSLLETYLEKVEAFDCANLTDSKNWQKAACEKNKAENDLVGALVRFAQKVLFVANNDSLLSGGKEKYIPENFKSDPALINAKEITEETLKSYILVLQAVGNSLLVQADDFEKRKDHENRLKKRAPLEAAAYQRAYYKSAQGHLSDLISSLEAKQEGYASQLEKRRILEEKIAGNETKETEAKASKKKAEQQLDQVTDIQERFKELPTLLDADGKIRSSVDVLLKTYNKLPDSEKSGSKLSIDNTKSMRDAANSLKEAFSAMEDKLSSYSVNPAYQKQAENAIAGCNGEFNSSDAGDNAVFKCQSLNIIAQTAGHLVEGGKNSSGSYWNELDKAKSAAESISGLAVNGVISGTENLGKLSAAVSSVENWSNSGSVTTAYENIASVKSLFDNLKEAGDKLKKSIADTENELKTLAGELKECKSELTKAPAQATLDANNRELTTAIGVLNHDSVKAWPPSMDSPYFSRQEFAGALNQKLASLKGGASTPDISDTDVTTTQSVIRKSGFATGSAYVVPSDAKDPKDVLDSLIAGMQYEYLNEVKENGAESDNALHAAQAIKAAYAYRSGMAYLRPSIAYLRSSSPATTLQGDTFPSGANENLLVGGFWRSTPIIANILKYRDNLKRQVPEEIDKQFWHNINKVKVSGSGSTNYVIAKDDIGNWYVKNYSSDATAITNSAFNLAKFGFGPSMGLQLPVGGDSEGAENQQGSAQPTVGSKLFDKYTKEYQDQTKAQYKKALALLTEDKGLHATVKNAWTTAGFDDKDQKQLEDMLDGAAKELEAAHTGVKDKKDLSEQAAGVVTALRAGLRFKRSLDIGIDGLAFESAKANAKDAKDAKEIETQSKPLREKARKAADEAIMPILKSLSSQRAQTIDDYEQAIKFIGEAVSKN
ncbi:hypothetical protein [Desulfatibacillum aliphaticivorans]|nr:hypothetical protein [Desulfatibacillum aliphaticivorans]